MTLDLYDLPEPYQRLAELPLDDPSSGLEGAYAIECELETLAEEVSVKVLSLAKVIVSLEGEADLLEQHARLLTGKAQARRRRADFLKRWMQLQMEGAGVDRAKDAFVTVWLQTSPPSVVVLDEDAVTADLKRVTLRLPLSSVPAGMLGLVQTCDVDKATIAELIKRTGELPAGVDYRRGERHLRIRA